MDLCSFSYMNDLSLNRYYNGNASSFDDLPDGLVVDILSRLPVKTLVLSTCVCKLWYSIIRSPSFNSAHLARSISDPSTYYIFLFRHNSLTVISDNPLVIRHQHFKFPFETQFTYPELIGACNGLVCVTDIIEPGVDIYLINPFIQHKCKRLDAESSCYADLIQNIGFGISGAVLNIGFGYSEVDDDYKVIRMITRCADTTRECECASIYEVEIYSLKSGKWKALDVSIAIEVAFFISSPVFMHGCLYWQARDHLQKDEYCLLCFDLKDELFSKIELPKTYFPRSWTRRSCTWARDRHVFVKNGSLTIVLCDLQSVPPSRRICLFVLKKKSGEKVRWKEFDYKCDYFIPSYCIGFGAMGLSGGGGRVIFVEKSFRTEYIVTVDLDNSCAMERLDFSTDVIKEAINVSESLVLLSD